MSKAFDRTAMLERAKQRGGTASMIICAVSNDLKNSDLRADNPQVIQAFNERFELLEAQRDDLLIALKAQQIANEADEEKMPFKEWLILESVAKSLVNAAIAKAEGR